jgi:hypothetical protein
MASTSWSPDPAGLQELLACFKQAETGDSATQRAVLQVCAEPRTSACFKSRQLLTFADLEYAINHSSPNAPRACKPIFSCLMSLEKQISLLEYGLYSGWSLSQQFQTIATISPTSLRSFPPSLKACGGRLV